MNITGILVILVGIFTLIQAQGAIQGQEALTARQQRRLAAQERRQLGARQQRLNRRRNQLGAGRRRRERLAAQRAAGEQVAANEASFADVNFKNAASSRNSLQLSLNHNQAHDSVTAFSISAGNKASIQAQQFQNENLGVEGDDAENLAVNQESLDANNEGLNFGSDSGIRFDSDDALSSGRRAGGFSSFLFRKRR